MKHIKNLKKPDKNDTDDIDKEEVKELIETRFGHMGKHNVEIMNQLLFSAFDENKDEKFNFAEFLNIYQEFLITFIQDFSFHLTMHFSKFTN